MERELGTSPHKNSSLVPRAPSVQSEEGRQRDKGKVSLRYWSSSTYVGQDSFCWSLAAHFGRCGALREQVGSLFSPHLLPEVCHKGETESYLSGKNEMIPKVSKVLRDPLGRKVLRK